MENYTLTINSQICLTTEPCYEKTRFLHTVLISHQTKCENAYVGATYYQVIHYRPFKDGSVIV